MKKLLLSLCAVFAFGTMLAQNTNDELEILKDLAAAERKALVSENMMLSNMESEKFWPLYDAYRAEVREIEKKSMKNLERFAENYEKMDDATAMEIMDNYFKNEMELLKAQNTHRMKMQKELPAKLVMRYMQIENKMDAIVNFGYAAEIPLIIKD